MKLKEIIRVPYTLKNKFILLASIFIFIPMLVTTLLSSFVFNNFVDSKISESNSYILSVVNSSINMMVEDIEDTGNVILASYEVQSGLSSSETNASEVLVSERNIMKLLINITNNKSYISNILLFNDHILCCQEKGTDKQYLADYIKSNVSRLTGMQWYKTIIDNDGKGCWMAGEEFEPTSNNILIYGKELKNLNTLDSIGTLAMGIDKRIFDDIFSNISQSEHYKIFIKSGNTVIYQSDPDSINNIRTEDVNELVTVAANGSATQIYDNKKYLISYDSNNMAGWEIICSIPYDSIAKGGNDFKNLTIVFLIVLYFITVVGIYLFTNKATRQLKLLRLVIGQFKQSNELGEISFDKKDEAGQIGIEFVSMVKKNKELNTNLYQMIIKQREAELLSLQSQINPHFLYNTLDTIYWMAQKIDAKNISKMIINLSKMFKLSLNYGEYLSTVKNELEQIKCYTEIQKTRYQNKFDIYIDIKSEIMENRIVKLLLQPILENAICHGIEPKTTRGYVSVKGYEEGQDMVFEVEDNGVGFDFQSIEKNRSYALKNVDERIKLYYGSEYGITINSIRGKGTKVVIRLKKI